MTPGRATRASSFSRSFSRRPSEIADLLRNVTSRSCFAPRPCLRSLSHGRRANLETGSPSHRRVFCQLFIYDRPARVRECCSHRRWISENRPTGERVKRVYRWCIIAQSCLCSVFLRLFGKFSREFGCALFLFSLLMDWMCERTCSSRHSRDASPMRRQKSRFSRAGAMKQTPRENDPPLRNFFDVFLFLFRLFSRFSSSFRDVVEVRSPENKRWNSTYDYPYVHVLTRRRSQSRLNWN